MARLFKQGEEIILTPCSTSESTNVTYVGSDPIVGKGYSIVKFKVGKHTYYRTFPDHQLSKAAVGEQQILDNKLYSDIKDQITDMQSQISQMYDKMETIKSLLK